MKSLTIAFLLAASVAGTAQASSVASGLPGASYSQSGAYAGYGSQSLFNGGMWNNGNWGDGWAQVDLQSNKNINSVSFFTEQLPNGRVSQSVYISDSAIGNAWHDMIPVATFEGNTINNTPITLNFAATSGRYVEIVANGGPSWTALRDATVSAVPEPSTYGMLLAGLALTGWVARRRKA